MTWSTYSNTGIRLLAAQLRAQNQKRKAGTHICVGVCFWQYSSMNRKTAGPASCRRSAVLFEKAAKGCCQSRRHHFTSWGMVILSIRSLPSVASAIIMVIS